MPGTRLTQPPSRIRRSRGSQTTGVALPAVEASLTWSSSTGPVSHLRLDRVAGSTSIASCHRGNWHLRGRALGSRIPIAFWLFDFRNQDCESQKNQPRLASDCNPQSVAGSRKKMLFSPTARSPPRGSGISDWLEIRAKSCRGSESYPNCRSEIKKEGT